MPHGFGGSAIPNDQGTLVLRAKKGTNAVEEANRIRVVAHPGSIGQRLDCIHRTYGLGFGGQRREVGQNGFFVRNGYVQSGQCTLLVFYGFDPFLKLSNAIQFEEGISRRLPSFSFEFFGEQRRRVGVRQGLAEQAQSNGV